MTNTARNTALFFLTLILIPMCAVAQSPASLEPLSDPLPFQVIEPANAQANTPIVIALHGVGSTSEKFGRVLKRLMKLPYRVVLPNAPFRTRRGYSWYKIRSASSDADVTSAGLRLYALIHAVRERWPMAPKPTLMGYSQGAVMVYHMMANYSVHLSAGVALAGYLVPDDIRIQASTPQSPPLFVSNGKNDKTVPFQEGREAGIAFFSEGFNVTFFPHNGGHGCPRRVWSEASAWIQAQMTR